MPVGGCSANYCGMGYVCSSGNICCPSAPANRCPSGADAVGACINGQCGVGFTCDVNSNLCCPVPTQTCELCHDAQYCDHVRTVTCSSGQDAVGACVSGQCGPGFTCEAGTNLCCASSECYHIITCIGIQGIQHGYIYLPLMLALQPH